MTSEDYFMESNFERNNKRKVKHEFPDDDFDYRKEDPKRNKKKKNFNRERQAKREYLDHEETY